MHDEKTALQLIKIPVSDMGNGPIDGGWKFLVYSEKKMLKFSVFSGIEMKGGQDLYLDGSYKRGNVFSFGVTGNLEGKVYTIDDMPDGEARVYINKKKEFGVKRTEFVSVIPTKEYLEFDWENDCRPYIVSDEVLFYKLHVRGFSKSISAGGYFSNIAEKSSYFKKLGITSLILMPAYEYFEFDENRAMRNRYQTQESVMPNFWGYSEGYYYAPKSIYGSDDGTLAGVEFKNMVKRLHKDQIEIIMEFYFPQNMAVVKAVDILRFWAYEYHVDGFRVIACQEIVKAVQDDIMLSDLKLICDDISVQETTLGAGKVMNLENDRLFSYGEGFMYTTRRFLRGDENSINPYCEHMLKVGNGVRTINFITDNNGFTLMDLVSYERRHNEQNCEYNKDGNKNNISMNCGIEGPTDDKEVVARRHRMIKNALTMLICSASVPMILAGDEFGRTQRGNNNAYCQDNDTSYIDWNLLEENSDIFEFTRMLINFRKKNCCIHPIHPFSFSDISNKGMPDVSFQGELAWYPDMEEYVRNIGFLYCGEYSGQKEDVYIVYNMHDKVHEFALPGTENGNWKLVFSTADDSKEAVAIKNKERKILLEPKTAAAFYRN